MRGDSRAHKRRKGFTIVVWTPPVTVAPVVKRRKANPWIERVTEAYRLARLSWEADREQVAIGYPEEMGLFMAEFPPPRYADFLRDMSNPDPDYCDPRYMEAS